MWGLGKAGLKSYGDLVPFIRDPERDVVLHAIAAFGQDTPLPVVLQLIDELISGDDRRAPAASEALRIIGGGLVLKNLIEAARTRKDSIDWILATLGRLAADQVYTALEGDPLLERLRPLLLLYGIKNWVAEVSVDIDLKFLLRQNL